MKTLDRSKMIGMKLTPAELCLGDVVRLTEAPMAFMDAIVKKTCPVLVERPFMSCADFSYGSRPTRIVYIGHEDVELSENHLVVLLGVNPETENWADSPVERKKAHGKK